MKSLNAIHLCIISLCLITVPRAQTWSRFTDLRVCLNYQTNPATGILWPTNNQNQALTEDEIIQQSALAFNLWQSILPDMNYRLVSQSQNPNYSVNFFFIPGQGGSSDQISYTNLTPFGQAGRKNDFVNNRIQHLYYAWVFNPLLSHWGPPSNTNICTTLPDPTTPRAPFDNTGKPELYINNQATTCFSPSNFPQYNKLAGHDLASIVQHEVGHCLMNFQSHQQIDPVQFDHADAPSVTVNDIDVYFPNYVPNSAYTRRPIYDSTLFVRQRTAGDGYSIMFMGNGLDFWNCRGIFPIDVHQLVNENYRVTYPNINGAIVLRKPDSSTYITSNWDSARVKMLWPTKGKPLTPAESASVWYLIDVHPRCQTHKTLAVGERHTLSIKENGSLWAWGANDKGQLGDGTVNASTSPKQISAGPWVAVTAGMDFSLGIKIDGTLWAWGDNSQGQIGDPSISSNQLTPRQVGSSKDWLSVSAGALHVLALKTNGRAYGWGYNADGELGIENSTSPQKVPTLVCPTAANCSAARFVALSAGSNHSLALDINGAIWGWGSSLNGQLYGIASTNTPKFSTKSVGLYRWSSIEAGHEHSAAMSNGSIYTWGKNDLSQLGQGFSGGTGSAAKEATNTANWAYLMPGQWNSGGARTDGSWYMWGYNWNGQLGNNSFTTSSIAVRENRQFTNWIQGAARQLHTLAQRKDGTLWGWGNNPNGELGTGSTQVDNPIPIQSKYVANTISVTRTTYPASPTVTTINLSTVGSMNWSKWSSSSYPNTKQINSFQNEYRVLQKVGDYAKIGTGTVTGFSGNSVVFNWTTNDEITQIPSGSNLNTGIYLSGTGVNRGFRLTVPTRNASRTLYVYVGAYRASGKLSARLSDGSLATYTNTAINSSGTATTHTNGMYAITFSSINPTSNLIVEWTVNTENTTSGDRFVTLLAAAIE